MYRNKSRNLISQPPPRCRMILISLRKRLTFITLWCRRDGWCCSEPSYSVSEFKMMCKCESYSSGAWFVNLFQFAEGFEEFIMLTLTRESTGKPKAWTRTKHLAQEISLQCSVGFYWVCLVYQAKFVGQRCDDVVGRAVWLWQKILNTIIFPDYLTPFGNQVDK